MSDERDIKRLLEEVLDLERTPEDVCREHPELLGEVRARWLRVRGLVAELDELFVAHGELESWPQVPAGPPVIAGYEIESVLGRGGMGVVYKARQHKLGRAVALKMLLSGAYASTQELARFVREAQAAASLRSANIVQIYDVGETEGRPYFTMEYVEGGSLAQRLAGVPQAPRWSAQLVATLARAVHVAHTNGIVHRDLKPANVLLALDGTPKITDFGLARRVDGGAAVTRSGLHIGTPSYMAPEQARGDLRAIGPASDVYALGAIAYELLTGGPPFRGASASETERQVLADEPVPPSRSRVSVPRDLETIVLQCLHKDPARRYASAEALALDLERFLAGEPIHARPVGAFERAVKWARRRPARSIAFGAGVLGLAGITLVLAWFAWQRAGIVRAASADLDEVVSRQVAGDWRGADVALERANVRLAGGGTDELRARALQAERELALVKRLDEIRMSRAKVTRTTRLGFEASAVEYAAEFEHSGFASRSDPVERVAERIRASPIRAVLTGALDDWAVITLKDDETRDWLLAIARLVDPDPKWRDRARDPQLWRDGEALAAFLRTMPVEGCSAAFLVALGERVGLLGGDDDEYFRRVRLEDYFRRVQLAHHDDYWANYNLGRALRSTNNLEAIGHYRSAIALRPDIVPAYMGVTTALMGARRFVEADEYVTQMLRIAPDEAATHLQIGYVRLCEERDDEVLSHAHEALRLDPKCADAYLLVAEAQLPAGEFAAVIEAAERVIELSKDDPPDLPTTVRAQALLRTSQRLLAVQKRLPSVLDGSYVPSDADECIRYASLCVMRERHADAVRIFEMAFSRDAEMEHDLARRMRLTAARSAVAASAVPPDAEGAPSEEQRSRWREQAFVWLRRDLAAWDEALGAGEQVLANLQKLLELWQNEPLFASVRDPQLVVKLPADERDSWLGLWNDVAALRERARAVR